MRLKHLPYRRPLTPFFFVELVSDAVDLEDRKQKCMGSLKMPPFEMVLGEASNMFDEFIVKGNRRIPLAVSLINKDRKRFDDFSSLDLSWESTNTVDLCPAYYPRISSPNIYLS